MNNGHLKEIARAPWCVGVTPAPSQAEVERRMLSAILDSAEKIAELKRRNAYLEEELKRLYRLYEPENVIESLGPPRS